MIIGRPLARIAGARPIGEREAVGEAERRGGQRRARPGATDQSHVPRGRHDRRACQARARHGSVHCGAWPNAIPTTSSASSVGASADRDQGGLAAPRPGQPPGPDRRRPGRVAGRDAADGRDQRRLRGADPRVRPRDGGGPPSDAGPTSTRRRPAARRAAAAEADPPGHRPRRHDARRSARATRHGRRRTAGRPRRATPLPRPAAAARRAVRRRAAARVDADRPAGARPGPQLPPARRRRPSTSRATT